MLYLYTIVHSAKLMGSYESSVCQSHTFTCKSTDKSSQSLGCEDFERFQTFEVLPFLYLKEAVTPIVPSVSKCSSRHFIFHRKHVCSE